MVSPAVPRGGMARILAGSWLARVERPSGAVEIGLHFTVNRLAFIVSGAHGVGFWRPQGTGIRYRIKEFVLDDDGDFSGYIDIIQSGAVVGDRLVTTGQSRVYGADGTLMRTVPVRISAVRKEGQP